MLRGRSLDKAFLMCLNEGQDKPFVLKRRLGYIQRHLIINMKCGWILRGRIVAALVGYLLEKLTRFRFLCAS